MKPPVAPCAALLAALLLAGCSTPTYRYAWADVQANPREFFNLNAPVVAAGAEVAGGSIEVQQWQALIVRLAEDPASGLTWRLRPLPRGAVVAPVQHDYTAKPGADPAAPAGGGEALFRLRGIAPGTQAVTIDAVRPGSTLPEKSLAFDVVVR